MLNVATSIPDRKGKGAVVRTCGLALDTGAPTFVETSLCATSSDFLPLSKAFTEAEYDPLATVHVAQAAAPLDVGPNNYNENVVAAHEIRSLKGADYAADQRLAVTRARQVLGLAYQSLIGDTLSVIGFSDAASSAAPPATSAAALKATCSSIPLDSRRCIGVPMQLGRQAEKAPAHAMRVAASLASAHAKLKHAARSRQTSRITVDVKGGR